VRERASPVSLRTHKGARNTFSESKSDTGELSDLLVTRSRNSSKDPRDPAARSLGSSYANYWNVKLPFFACNMSAGSGGRDEQWLGLKLDCIDENGLPALDGYLK